MRLRRRPVNRDIEKQVLIGFITSDRINHTLKHLLDPRLFQLNVGQTISRWIKEYYNLYNRAPGKDIQEIYLAERSNLDEEVALDVSEFLQTISEQYADNPPNEDYLLNQATVYLKKQVMVTSAKEVILTLENSNGDMASLSKAEAAFGRYKKSTVDIRIPCNPYDPDKIDTFFFKKKSPLLVLKGELGKFVGDLHRGYLLGILGRMKAGKTFYVQHIITEAVESRLNCIFVSLEMPEDKMIGRFWQQIGCYGEEDGKYEFPVFDCKKNQNGKCEKSQRTSHVKKGEAGYERCSYCKEGKDGLQLIIDLVEIKRDGITRENIQSLAKNFGLHYGRNCLRFLSYPAFSANLTQIMNDIDSLEWQEGFIPDVIAIDYPGILAPEERTPYNKEYTVISETWKTLKRIAQERQVLLIAPIQANRAGVNVEHLQMEHTSGSIDIQAHSDKCITLNQNGEDYEKKIMRIGKIIDRWGKANKNLELKSLTQLECGQPYINGVITKIEYKNKGK